jgi:hypothetical protein
MSKNRYLTLIVITALFFSFVSCSKNKQQVTASLIENSTSIKFEKDLIDFGKLSSGEVVTCSFKFKNTGKNDLIISSVTGNCGCTVADYPRTPIAPNQEGQITVRYDSEGTNQFRVVKEISVLANTTPATTKLRIVADIN